MAKNPFNIGIFSGPSYSAFSVAHGNRVSTKPGVIKPVWCDYLDTGERLKDLDLGALVRQAPMLAPTLDTYEVTADAFAVRLRTLGMAGRNPWQYEDFFNYNKNLDGSYELPMFYLGRFWSVNNPLKLGTLYESLNYPSWKWLRETILEQMRNIPFFYNPVAKAYYYDLTPALVVAPAGLPEKSISSVGSSVGLDIQSLTNSFTGAYELIVDNRHFVKSSMFNQSSTLQLALSTFAPTLVTFALARYPSIFKPFSGWNVQDEFDEEWTLGAFFEIGPTDEFKPFEPFNVLDEIYRLYKVDAESVLAEYEDFVFDHILSLVANSQDVWDASLISGSIVYLYGSSYSVNSLFSYICTYLFSQMKDDVPYLINGQNTGIFSNTAAGVMQSVQFSQFGFRVGSSTTDWYDRAVPDYYFNAYWKIISDWYINTALFEPDSFYLSHYCHLDNSGYYSHFVTTNSLFFRYWKNDYFTSAFPNSQLGNAVGIPVNGTIIDFRNANAWQRFKERLQYAGSRFRDVLYAVTGKRTSSAIMDMSEPLGRWKSIVNVDSVLQTSQSSGASPQGAYSGTGLAYKMNGRSVSYTAEEPTVIMVVLNINPASSAYFDGFPKKFLRSNLYQYDVPNLANIGEQQIYNYELFFGIDSRQRSASYSPVFGWQRRYGDFMWTPDEVHGDFRGNLDYWHNARTFTSAPVLGEKFLQVRPEDDNLNRVFAVSSSVVDKFYCHVFFSGHIIRHLPKHAYYDL